MWDAATRNELAAMAYERAECDPEIDDEFILLAEGEERSGSSTRWFDALLLCPSTLIC